MSFLRADLAQLNAYQAPHPPADTDVPEQSAALVLDPLDTNESPIDLPAALKSTLADYYQDGLSANRYPDGSHAALKSAVRDYALDADGGLSLALENITLGNGSDELIRSVIMATCIGGYGAILTAAPTFSMYGILAQTLGVPVHTVERDPENFAVDVAAAQAVIERSGSATDSARLPVRVVFMVHPNSPTGNALTDGELTWLRQLPDDILVVVDEAYFEFSGQTTLSDALSRPNWLVLRTFSKAFRLAAHRVGYGIGHPQIITALEKLRLPYNLPSFSQQAATLALTYSQQLLAQIPDIVSERDRLYSAFSELPYLSVWPSQSNFIYVRLSDRGLAHLDETDLNAGLKHVFQQLKEKGTLIRHTGGGLRISIGTADQNQRTLANLQQAMGLKR